MQNKNFCWRRVFDSSRFSNCPITHTHCDYTRLFPLFRCHLPAQIHLFANRFFFLYAYQRVIHSCLWVEQVLWLSVQKMFFRSIVGGCHRLQRAINFQLVSLYVCQYLLLFIFSPSIEPILELKDIQIMFRVIRSCYSYDYYGWHETIWSKVIELSSSN